MAELTPAEELRKAATALRNPYRCGDSAHMEAEADLLDAIALQYERVPIDGVPLVDTAVATARAINGSQP